jgi:hypothetical protein
MKEHQLLFDADRERGAGEVVIDQRGDDRTPAAGG